MVFSTKALGMTPTTLVEKLEVLSAQQAVLRHEAHRAQTGEGIVRAQMGGALIEAIAARQAAEAARDDAVFARYRDKAKLVARPDRRNRLRIGLELVLKRLGFPGHRLILLRSGLWRPGAATPLLDQSWYLARYPDAAASRLPPLVHYLLIGAKLNYWPHPLFDGGDYARTQAHGLAATGLTPLEHFVRVGAAQGCNPHPLFNVAHYVAATPELAETGENPLAHFLRDGGQTSPHRLFQPQFYRQQLPGDEPCDNPLLHYLAGGFARGFKPHPLFDPSWYLATYPQNEGQEPLSHFVAHSAEQLTNPGPWFDTEHYLRTRGAGRPAHLDPLSDYLSGGAWTSAEPQPGFSRIGYLAAHADLAAQGVTPLEYWARQGGA